MAYADSAIDYNWEIVNISPEQRIMVVKYTADSSRPEVFLNLEPAFNQFNESDLTVLAERHAEDAVIEWDQYLEAQASNISFNADSWVGNSYSGRYKVRTYDAEPLINELTHTLTSYDSEGPDDICTKYTIVAMNDSDKGDARQRVFMNNIDLWNGLLSDNRLDSAIDALGITGTDFDQYDANNISMVIGSLVQFGDSLSIDIQTALGYGDSDWAAWLVSKGAGISGIPSYSE